MPTQALAERWKYLQHQNDGGDGGDADVRGDHVA